ncbi:MAG: D-tyrosyl-tRNA(Tyr) deacylase [Deltaproteobacteria bacterium]|nr:D-tyrosyl-tRNA(Tyr) deacylase [Deltaproteobacteria bacterium]
MRAVVQRVSQAAVAVHGQTVGAIDRGLLVLLSVGQGDDDADLAYMVDKIAGLRIFSDDAGKMNLAVGDVGGAILLVSQFTLHGDARRGKRPSFTAAMAPEPAAAMVDRCGKAWRDQGLPVQQGVFGADMQVSLCNDGPVTILLDSKKLF